MEKQYCTRKIGGRVIEAGTISIGNMRCHRTPKNKLSVEEVVDRLQTLQSRLPLHEQKSLEELRQQALKIYNAQH